MCTLRLLSSAPQGVFLGGLVLFTLGSCGQDEAGPNPPSQVQSPSAWIDAARVPRSADPRVAEARLALDHGQLESSRALVPGAASLAGPPEGDLLLARLCLLEGDMNGAETALGRARRSHPLDPRVLATSVEIHAWGGMLQTAEGELAAVAQRGGTVAPELLRARGVVLISSPGGARLGLALLEQAQGLDPNLPFMARSLGQAYLLVGRSYMGTDRALALQHARAAVEADPGELDALVFLGDTLILNGEWGDALKTFEETLLRGRTMELELAGHYKRAGFVALAQGHRSLAIQSFLRAKELGLQDEELGTAGTVLRVEARKVFAELAAAGEDPEGEAERAEKLALVRALDPRLPELQVYDGSLKISEGIAALEAEEFSLAGELLDQALALDPGAVEAHLYRGHVFFAQQDFLAAAEQWHWVLDDLRLDGVELPEPLHLRIADALMQGGKTQGAREVLQAYLVLEEGGRWVEQTRQLLQILPIPADSEGLGPESVVPQEADPGAGGR